MYHCAYLGPWEILELSSSILSALISEFSNGPGLLQGLSFCREYGEPKLGDIPWTAVGLDIWFVIGVPKSQPPWS